MASAGGDEANRLDTDAVDAKFAELKNSAIMGKTIGGPSDNGYMARAAAIKARNDAIEAKKRAEREAEKARRRANLEALRAVDTPGSNLLRWAARASRPEHGTHVIQTVLGVHEGEEAQTSVEHRGLADNTALHRAVDSVNLPVVTLLLEQGADVNARNAFGLTPLHKAAKHSQIELVRALLLKGADVDPRDKQGYTPLMRAVQYGDAFIAQVLLDEGADVDLKVVPEEDDGLKDNERITMLDLAREGGNPTVLQLVESGAALKPTKEQLGWG